MEVLVKAATLPWTRRTDACFLEVLLPSRIASRTKLSAENKSWFASAFTKRSLSRLQLPQDKAIPTTAAISQDLRMTCKTSTVHCKIQPVPQVRLDEFRMGLHASLPPATRFLRRVRSVLVCRCHCRAREPSTHRHRQGVKQASSTTIQVVAFWVT